MTHSDIVTLIHTQDRILGCLYGQALGDTMGMPSELWPKSRVEQHFGWINTLLDGVQQKILQPTSLKQANIPTIQPSVSLLWMRLLKPKVTSNPILSLHILWLGLNALMHLRRTS